ncbi:MAG: long-chain-fatty-acid--CoA ligase [Deltaproteobacteria bacterium]|nr:long-chain-fatty-acid--CoA ligase [Deltaproteobacteria bacterium]MBN2844798.1 long-chain-fatty-acid--CoA ligase [Deltaproteobacteria bacterium]
MQVPMTPARILERAVKLYPEKEAIIDGDIRLTYREFYARVNRTSRAIEGLGISRGGRVAILDYNSHRYMEAYFGMALARRVLLPLNTRLSHDEYVYILNNSGAEAVIFHADFRPIVDTIRKRVTTVKHYYIAEGSHDNDNWISGSYETLINTASPDPVPFNLKDENETLNLYYTSGTTGKPKGVMLTHRNIYANALTTIISFQLTDTTCWYHIAPLFHIADAFFIWSVTYQGGRHILQRSFDTKTILKTIQDKGITSTVMVPTMINFLLDEPEIDRYDLSSLEWVMVGGSPMSPANAKRMMEKFGCRYISGYGLTETTPLLTVGNIKDTLAAESENKRMTYLTRTGIDAIGVDIRVVDESGNDIPRDGTAVGEIIVRGDNVMKGYWNLPEETAQAIKDDYFYTGDLATVDPEGYVLIVDRSKDVIISGGENITSVEIENAIYTNPKVLECAVIPVPDEKWGEVTKAVVSLKKGVHMTDRELVDYCRDRLAHFKVPRYVDFVSDFPRTGSGKIRKTELRKTHGIAA